MSKKTNTSHKTIETIDSHAVLSQTNADLKNALLIVSVLLNVTVLIAWLLAQTSSQYATQLIGLLS